MSDFSGFGEKPLNDFFLKIAKGEIPGHSVGTIFGRNRDLDPMTPSMVWDFGPTQAREVYLTENTELFLSSTDVLDINIGILVSGMTDDYIVKKELHTFTLGQTQQSVGNWFRIFKITVVSGNAPIGNMYMSESDSLTLGIPDDSSKVHAFMFFGSNTSHKASMTIPANHSMYVYRLFLSTRRGEDAVFSFMVKGGANPGFIEESNFPIYQSTLFESFDPPFPITEKIDIEFIAETLTNNSQVVANIGYVMVDNSVRPL